MVFKARIKRNAFRYQDPGLFPDPGELRGVMAQMEAFLELIERNTKVKSSSDLI